MSLFLLRRRRHKMLRMLIDNLNFVLHESVQEAQPWPSWLDYDNTSTTIILAPEHVLPQIRVSMICKQSTSSLSTSFSVCVRFGHGVWKATT